MDIVLLFGYFFFIALMFLIATSFNTKIWIFICSEKRGLSDYIMNFTVSKPWSRFKLRQRYMGFYYFSLNAALGWVLPFYMKIGLYLLSLGFLSRDRTIALLDMLVELRDAMKSKDKKLRENLERFILLQRAIAALLTALFLYLLAKNMSIP